MCTRTPWWMSKIFPNEYERGLIGIENVDQAKERNRSEAHFKVEKSGGGNINPLPVSIGQKEDSMIRPLSLVINLIKKR